MLLSLIPDLTFVNRLDAHHKLYISMAVACVVSVSAYGKFSQPVHILVTWLGYCLTSLTLSWITILSSHPADVKKEVYAQDSSRTLIFLFAVTAAFVSLFAILLLLKNTGDSVSQADLTGHILLSLASVICSWWLVHTIFTLRYAHLFYSDVAKGQVHKSQKPGGMEFPDEDQPDYLDFTYFSFVLGMTFQVSDVQITSKRIRRLALVHGILSFAFNTVIVALSINIVSGLVQNAG
ncbi:DUF1345 domain-containing protein [Dyadobacter sp. CY323]|uniref:DUF1345 domain-containing protein n=1 Tax=Dyadobacter sp. CY323 TaxID=2907302 RepID=UPI001F2A2B8B|nr:DUF1345 domain-containing protein [Dyadobacter sp. CY323]MCE6991049.1 DUF1345 domain-containing protein [Dyadobacter sp. CY323]